MKFEIDLHLDGYDNYEEERKACIEFIDQQLGSSGSSVKIIDEARFLLTEAFYALQQRVYTNDLTRRIQNEFAELSGLSVYKEKEQ